MANYDDMERASLLLNIIRVSAEMGSPYTIIATEATEELKNIAEACTQIKADRDAKLKADAEEAYQRQLTADAKANETNKVEVLAVEELPPATTDQPPADEPSIDRRI